MNQDVEPLPKSPRPRTPLAGAPASWRTSCGLDWASGTMRMRPGVNPACVRERAAFPLYYLYFWLLHHKSLEPTEQPLFCFSRPFLLWSVETCGKKENSSQKLPPSHRTPVTALATLYSSSNEVKDGRPSKIGIASGEIPRGVPREGAVTCGAGGFIAAACRRRVSAA